MKKDIHPKEYRQVVFKDISNDHSFMTRSTVATKETVFGKTARNIRLLSLKFQIHPILFTPARSNWSILQDGLISSARNLKSIFK